MRRGPKAWLGPPKAVLGRDGRPNLTPMWFDYDGDKVLVNVASHRKKVDWIRNSPEITILIKERLAQLGIV